MGESTPMKKKKLLDEMKRLNVSYTTNCYPPEHEPTVYKFTKTYKLQDDEYYTTEARVEALRTMLKGLLEWYEGRSEGFKDRANRALWKQAKQIYNLWGKEDE